MTAAVAGRPARTGLGSATLTAIRNALELGGSLVFTWSIALGIRFLVPRHLGPSRFGTLSFADAFTVTCFIALNLGMDTYIRKEVAVRPEHGSDFFGGAALVRAVMTLAIFGLMCGVLHATNRPRDIWTLVGLYGVAQFFVTTNATLSALLHARGRVRAMSILAVATKVIWAIGVLLAVFTRSGLWAYAVSYIASESVESAVLYRLAQKHLGLELRLDLRATGRMLACSLPYYLTLFATTAYGKLDVSLLSVIGAHEEEVGWYSAASSVANLTLLLTPLIGWVLMPMFARAMAASRDELHEQVRRSMELILSLAIPVCAMIVLSAPVLVSLVFGAAFGSAATALRILAAMSVITYVAIVLAQTLTMLERAWALTVISVAGLIVNVGLNLLILPRALARLGPGGGGTGAATAMLATEIFVTSCMAMIVGRVAFDRRGASTILKSVAATAVVCVAHRALAPVGPLRLLVDAALYGVLALATGAIRPRAILQVVRASMRGSEGAGETTNRSVAATREEPARSRTRAALRPGPAA